MVSPWRMGSQLDIRTVETSFYNIFKCHCDNKLEPSHPLVPWFPHLHIQPTSNQTKCLCTERL